MPIYEFQCQHCRKISSFLILNRQEPFTPRCRHCDSTQMARVLSRVHVRLSEETRMERLADPNRLGRLDENDPAGMARFMKDMAQASGEDFGGEDLDQLVEEAVEEGYREKEAAGDGTDDLTMID